MPPIAFLRAAKKRHPARHQGCRPVSVGTRIAQGWEILPKLLSAEECDAIAGVYDKGRASAARSSWRGTA
jgi:hypothetical protein